MPTDPTHTKDFKRLKNAVERGRSNLEWARKKRLEVWQQIAGYHYGENSAPKIVPINILDMMMSIITRQLVARNPRVLFTPKTDGLRVSAYKMEAAVNQAIQEMDLQAVMEECVKEAMITTGFVQISLQNVGERMTEMGIVPLVSPRVTAIDLDDWSHDPCCKRLEEAAWLGRKRRVKLEDAKNDKSFDAKEREKLKAMSSTRLDEDGNEKLTGVTEKDTIDTEEYNDYVELWDIYLRDENSIVTYSAEGGDEPLKTTPWKGPSGGPYKWLNFGKVSSNAMGLGPILNIIDLHMIENMTFRKLARQAERQKDVDLYRGTAANDAERIKDAKDGEMVMVADPAGVVRSKFGGPSAENQAYAIYAYDIATRMAGNLELLGGISPQSETATQDEILNSRVSEKIADLQDRTLKVTRDVCKDLAWYEWNDPFLDRKITRQIPGLSFDLHSRVTPSDRQGEFPEYEIEIEPYSMQPRTPQARLRALMETLNNVILPGMQAMQAQGWSIDFGKLIEQIARLGGVDELKEVLVYAEPQIESNTESFAGKPANTNRTYTRVNKPGATGPGKNQVLMQHLMGGKLQDSERASLTTPVG